MAKKPDDNISDAYLSFVVRETTELVALPMIGGGIGADTGMVVLSVDGCKVSLHTRHDTNVERLARRTRLVQNANNAQKVQERAARARAT